MSEKEPQTGSEESEGQADVDGYALPIMVPPTPSYGGGFPNPMPLPVNSFLPNG